MRARWHCRLALVFACWGAVACSKTPPELAAYVRSGLPPGVTPTIDVELGGAVELLSAQVTPASGLKPSSHVELTLYWRRVAAVPAGYRLFTSLLDAAGERVLVLDTSGPLRRLKDGEAILPPSAWEKGRVYVDKLSFYVPNSLSTDSFRIVCGIAREDERLPITRGKAVTPNDSVVVATLPVERARPAATLPVLWLPRPTAPITIDGKLDDPSWDRAALTGPFVDAATGGPIAGSGISGSVRLLHDDRALYVGFELFDPDLRSGAPAAHSQQLVGDALAIVIDPDGEGDNRDYYELELGPSNQLLDSAYETHDGVADDTWSSHAQSVVSLDGTLDDANEDVGFTAELAIPWSAFARAKRVPPTFDDTWRMNFYTMKEGRPVAAWAPTLGQDYQQGTRFGRIRFANMPNARAMPMQALPSALRPKAPHPPSSGRR